ncbi:MAG: hypothetical protein GC171_10335 [Terrimonas sp.]|nr:hypothetical protein [Terrimonas sp.]
MKYMILLALGFLSMVPHESGAQPVQTNYISRFQNSNHPEVAYWFFASNMMPEARWKGKIDSFVKYSKYTLVFLTERDGCNFYDTNTMHPIFKKLVAYAHQKGLKIGLQVWKRDFNTRLENTDRLIQEGEVTLNEKGEAAYSTQAKGARNMSILLKSELFKIVTFKKTAEGFYDPATLRDITALATVRSDTSHVALTIKAGEALKGYTAYILTQHYYNYRSNFSKQAKTVLLNTFKAYADIPFDGIGLDEYKNLLIAREPVLKSTHQTFRERLYSTGMAERMKLTTGMDLGQVLFDMRYAPAGRPAIRIKAINAYMRLLRTATLDIEQAMYELGKKMYGKNAFIGLHDTFHNNLDRDEVWQTGVSWWNIKRDFGHTDENTSTPIQMGIGISNKENAMYNMFYDKSLETIWTKALYDLRYGIRTHYHAANDVQGWGVSIDKPEALEQINKVENCARLLNRFNPPFPAIKLLVVYGMEALYNWYPDTANRGLYDINDKLDMEGKTSLLWENGYLNAAVPTDLIEDGRLHLDANGKAVINGYTFDAIVFLYPQYTRKSTTDFFRRYVQGGGKLLIEGTITKDFDGKDVAAAWAPILSGAVAGNFSLENVAKLGIPKNILQDGVPNGKGMYTFTSIASLQQDKTVRFSFTDHGHIFSGTYKGLAAIEVDQEGRLRKLAASGFSSLERDGKTILQLNKAADIFLVTAKDRRILTIADDTHTTRVEKNEE